MDYYVHQAGEGISGFPGTPTMFGVGLGGVFKGLFRMMVLFERGLAVAEPHSKTAAKGFVSDVVRNAMTKTQPQYQDGLGLALIELERSKRPPE